MEYTLNGLIALVGDVHGELYNVSRQIIKLSDVVNHVILLGDIGFGFFKEGELENKILKSIPKNIKVWLLRGNHDDPDRWNIKYLVNPYPRLTFIKDNSILNINGKRFLAIGGGISIDQIYRTEGVSYWKDEYVKLPDKEVLEDDIYGILSHSGIVPPSLEGSPHALIVGGSDELKASLDREKIVFDTILKTAKPKVWFYGHYHKHNFFDYSGCKFYNLDINEVYLLSDDENR